MGPDGDGKGAKEEFSGLKCIIQRFDPGREPDNFYRLILGGSYNTKESRNLVLTERAETQLSLGVKSGRTSK